MNPKDKHSIITRNLQEITGEDVLYKILDKRSIKIYWGTATTGKPHIAYFLPIFKIKDFVDSGCFVKILLADIHAFLDNLKAPIEKIQARSIYYEKLIKTMLRSIDVDISKIDFVLGSSFQKKPEYFNDLMRILSRTNKNDAKRAGAEVVKQVSNSKLSSLVYPAMQALDEEYLNVDVQFGGVDQRKIFMYAREFLPLIKYKKRIHFMNPMIAGLNSEKMSSSDKNSKIDLLDSERDIREKILVCSMQVDGIISLFKHIIMPFYEIYKQRGDSNNKYKLEVLQETCIKINEKSYAFKELNEKEKSEIKEIIIFFLNEIIKPIREEMFKEPEIIANAYE